MKKRGLVLSCFIFVLLIGFVSAGWFSDAWSRITGNVITGNVIADDCSNVVGLYHFDGNVNDYSGNGNNGTENGGVTSVAGHVGGGAYSFDGVDDEIVIERTNNPEIDPAEITLGMWMKTNPNENFNKGVAGRSVGSSGTYTYGLQWKDGSSNNLIQGLITTTTSQVTLEHSISTITNNWHYYTLTYSTANSGTAKLYYDGVEVDSRTGIGTTLKYRTQYSNDDFFIGSVASNKYFKGQIDELIIYDRALSQNEITQLYNFGTGVNVSCGGGFTPSQICNNGSIEGTEVCEAGNLNGESCVSQGFDSGTLNCASNCLSFDTSSCVRASSCTDSDRDGYGIGSDLSGCSGSTTLADCDDSDSLINPGATEICGDGVDNNCTNGIDEMCSGSNVSWQQTLENAGFDIVSTFDDLDDWKGTRTDQVDIQQAPNDFPIKTADSSPSIWNAYSNWNGNDANYDNWIQDHGSSNVWRGTGKSMRMSMISNEPGYGPDRFITYFGDGSRNSGYDDMYAFYMVKINKSFYPTFIDSNNIGFYNQGDPFVDYNIKFAGAAHGFIAPYQHADVGTRKLYGWHQLHIGHRRLSADHYQATLRQAGWYENTMAGGDIDPGVIDDLGQIGSVPIPLDEWFGVEWHLKIGTPGTNTGTYELWIYDKDGIRTQVISRSDLYLQHSKLAGDKFNQFWIGGNSKHSYSSSLDPKYYVDDVIIDDQPIGQKYFSLLTGQIPTYQCSDGIDNDRDGYCDTAGALCTDGSTPGDSDCTSPTDDNETGVVIPQKIHPADLDDDGCIDQTEINNYIGLWFAGTSGVTIESVGAEIEFWQAGCGSSCTPTTCSALGYSCGSWSDGCRGTLDCGACTDGKTCSAGSCVVAGNWQQALENNFDYVSTFDELQSWTGSKTGTVSDQNDMPKLLNGTKSFWEYYSYYGPDFNQIWIGDHGNSNIWKGNKSLCLDYDGNKGPGRLGFSIGDKPSEGYPKDVYVFSMQKYNKEFFPTDGNNFLSFGMLKTLQISTGFRDIRDWGTIQEQSILTHAQSKFAYGLNGIILDFTLSNNKIRLRYGPITANRTGTKYIKPNGQYADSYTDLDNLILNDEWFGVEYHYVLSNPHGSPTGYIETWVYDKNGSILHNGGWYNIITFDDSATFLNHSFNKFVWGGNRQNNRGSESFGGRNDGFDATESHVYIDDTIVHGSRIGPTYFNLLNQNNL